MELTPSGTVYAIVVKGTVVATRGAVIGMGVNVMVDPNLISLTVNDSEPITTGLAPVVLSPEQILEPGIVFIYTLHKSPIHTALQVRLIFIWNYEEPTEFHFKSS